MKQYILVILLMAAVACKTNRDEQYSADRDSTVEEQSAPGVGLADTTYLANTQEPGPAFLPAGKAIVRKAWLELEVTDFTAFTNTMHSLVKLHDGWIAAENQSISDVAQQSILELRIPADKLDEFLAAISRTKVKTTGSNITAEDVTAKLVDTEGRLQAKRSIRARYMELLHQAKNMSDILELQREIDRITEEMEAAAYTIVHLKQEASYSTVYCTYSQRFAESSQQPGILEQLGKALKTGAEGLLQVMIGALAVWPLWIPGILGFWWLRRKSKARVANSGRAA